MVNLLTSPSLSQNFTSFFKTQRLGFNVYNFVFCGKLLQLNRSILYKLSNEVTKYLNILDMLMEDWIPG